MADRMILLTIKLEDRHCESGKTRHFVHGSLMTKPDMLQIMRYVDDPGYYLLYLDNEGVEMTDTYHDTLHDAMIQAELEFGVKSDEWISPDADSLEMNHK